MDLRSTILAVISVLSLFELQNSAFGQSVGAALSSRVEDNVRRTKHGQAVETAGPAVTSNPALHGERLQPVPMPGVEPGGEKGAPETIDKFDWHWSNFNLERLASRSVTIRLKEPGQVAVMAQAVGDEGPLTLSVRNNETSLEASTFTGEENQIRVFNQKPLAATAGSLTVTVQNKGKKTLSVKMAVASLPSSRRLQ